MMESKLEVLEKQIEKKRNKNFRVKVLMHEIFEDHRAKLYVTVDKSWKYVKEMQCHICQLCCLQDPIFLTTDENILLPPYESIGVVKEEDVIVGHICKKPEKRKCEPEPEAAEEVALAQQNLASSKTVIGKRPSRVKRRSSTKIRRSSSRIKRRSSSKLRRRSSSHMRAGTRR